MTQAERDRASMYVLVALAVATLATLGLVYGFGAFVLSYFAQIAVRAASELNEKIKKAEAGKAASAPDWRRPN